MAHALTITDVARNAMVDGLTALFNAGTPPGKIKFYSGSVPADVNASLGAAVLLSTITLSNTAFAAASGGVGTANAITSDTNAAASGTATFFRATNAAGTAVVQGTVGTSGCDANFDNNVIVASGTVAASAFTLTQPAT